MPRLANGVSRAVPIALLVLATSAVAAPAVDSHTDAALAAIVHGYRGCLTALDPSDRAVLQRRFGTATTPGVPAATGAQQQAELRAVRRLEAAHRAGRCPAPDPPASAGVLAAHASSPAPPIAATPSSGLSWTSPAELALLATIVLALGALAYGLRRDFGRPYAGNWGPNAGGRRRWGRRPRSRHREP